MQQVGREFKAKWKYSSIRLLNRILWASQVVYSVTCCNQYGGIWSNLNTWLLFIFINLSQVERVWIKFERYFQLPDLPMIKAHESSLGRVLWVFIESVSATWTWTLNTFWTSSSSRSRALSCQLPVRSSEVKAGNWISRQPCSFHLRV